MPCHHALVLDLLCGLQDTHCFLQLDLVDFDSTHSMLELSIVDKFICVIYILTLMKGGRKVRERGWEERNEGGREGGRKGRKKGGKKKGKKGREGGRYIVTEGRGSKDVHV